MKQNKENAGYRRGRVKKGRSGNVIH